MADNTLNDDGIMVYLTNDNFESPSAHSQPPPTPLPMVDKEIQRRAFLVTYSDANMKRYPTRDSFAQVVLTAFNKNEALVHEWCCSEEPHETPGQYHYHMAVNLLKPKRWYSVKVDIQKCAGIVVNFANEGLGYAWAVRYAAKVDTTPLYSVGHRDYDEINSDSSSVSAFRSSSENQACRRKSKADHRKAVTKKGLGSKRVPVFPSVGR